MEVELIAAPPTVGFDGAPGLTVSPGAPFVHTKTSVCGIAHSPAICNRDWSTLTGHRSLNMRVASRNAVTVNRGNFGALFASGGRQGELVAEQLTSTVDEVDSHGP